MVRYSLFAGIAALVVLLVMTGGCTQPSSTTQDTSSGITVTKPDDTHITVAFVGAPGMDGLLEMEMTVTDSSGNSITKSKGSRLATTPIQVHTTYSFTGSYAGKNHVFITGYFSDGSRKTLVDRDI